MDGIQSAWREKDALSARRAVLEPEHVAAVDELQRRLGPQVESSLGAHMAMVMVERDRRRGGLERLEQFIGEIETTCDELGDSLPVWRERRV